MADASVKVGETPTAPSQLEADGPGQEHAPRTGTDRSIDDDFWSISLFDDGFRYRPAPL